MTALFIVFFVLAVIFFIVAIAGGIGNSERLLATGLISCLISCACALAVFLLMLCFPTMEVSL